MNWLFALFHHLAAFGLVAILLGELLLLRQPFNLSNARQLQRLDIGYGIAAGLLLIVGLIRVIWLEKGWPYYSHSLPFWIKIGAFALMGLISIIPTLEFLRWRAPLKQNKLPEVSETKLKQLRRLVHWELALVPVILVCAALMARGYGFIG